MSFGVYVHIPFCVRKCPYCDFYSTAVSGDIVERYVKRLCMDIRENCSEGAGSVYFGGGTPSLLSPEQAGRIISAAAPAKGAEISIEANPNSVSPEKLEGYLAAGVNRISFGIQSLCGGELEALGRLHTADEAENAVNSAYNAGFRNISADIMLGVCGQTEDSLSETLGRLTALPINHISAYMLKIEEGTPYSKNGMRDRVPDDDTAADMYLMTAEYLENAGFYQYEISNFAQKGYECRHNLLYWLCGEYYGFGPAAHSFYGGKRYACRPDLDGYLSGGAERITDVLQETPPDFFERGMLKLRLSQGLCRSEIPSEQLGHFEKRFAVYEKAGLMKHTADGFALTREGFLVSNSIIVDLLSE